MYLSRLILDPRSREVRRDVADAQQLHRTVMSAFPAAPAGAADPRAHFGILYRLESDVRTGRLQLLVQSRVEPSWRLPPGYLTPSADGGNPATKQIDERYARLAPTTRLAFRVRANATKRIDRRRADDPLAGKRVDLYKEVDQLEWLRRRTDRDGFRLVAVRTSSGSQKEHGARPGENAAPGAAQSRSKLTFGGVLFDGELVITDAALFRRALEQGIGPGKAYGFGLLSVAPARG